MKKDTPHTPAISEKGSYISNIWKGVHAPETVISKTRRRIDEFMVVTGAVGFAEGVAILSPALMAGSAVEMGIGATDLAHAGAKARKAEMTLQG